MKPNTKKPRPVRGRFCIDRNLTKQDIQAWREAGLHITKWTVIRSRIHWLFKRK